MAEKSDIEIMTLDFSDFSSFNFNFSQKYGGSHSHGLLQILKGIPTHENFDSTSESSGDFLEKLLIDDYKWWEALLSVFYVFQTHQISFQVHKDPNVFNTYSFGILLLSENDFRRVPEVIEAMELLVAVLESRTDLMFYWRDLTPWYKDKFAMFLSLNAD